MEKTLLSMTEKPGALAGVSSLKTSYRTYNPMYLRVLKNTSKYSPLEGRVRKHSDGPPLSTLPSILRSQFKSSRRNRTLRLSKRSPSPVISKQTSPNLPFYIKGFNCRLDMPKEDRPKVSVEENTLRLKEFLKKVQDKYEDLYQELDYDDKNYITKNNIADYISMLKPKKKVSSFRSKTPGPIRLPTEISEFTPDILASADNIVKTFDPFGNGFISRNVFFGVLIMYEYTFFKTVRIAKVDITNSKNLVLIKSQVNRLKSMFSHYCKGKTIRKEVLEKALKNDKLHIEDLDISEEVNFGQFLLLAPYLVENYNKK